nr:MAG TPA: hypothetical protein [Caudoviricetes sp.]
MGCLKPKTALITPLENEDGSDIFILEKEAD